MQENCQIQEFDNLWTGLLEINSNYVLAKYYYFAKPTFFRGQESFQKISPVHFLGGRVPHKNTYCVSLVRSLRIESIGINDRSDQATKSLIRLSYLVSRLHGNLWDLSYGWILKNILPTRSTVIFIHQFPQNFLDARRTVSYQRQNIVRTIDWFVVMKRCMWCVVKKLLHACYIPRVSISFRDTTTWCCHKLHEKWILLSVNTRRTTTTSDREVDTVSNIHRSHSSDMGLRVNGPMTCVSETHQLTRIDASVIRQNHGSLATLVGVQELYRGNLLRGNYSEARRISILQNSYSK